MDAAACLLSELEFCVAWCFVLRPRVAVLSAFPALCRKVIIAAKLPEAIKAQCGASGLIGLQYDLVIGVARSFCQIDNILLAQARSSA